jgi:2'-phosphotransferase
MSSEINLNSKELSNISKSVSYILRHGAEKEGIQIDANGNVAIDDLLLWLNSKCQISVTVDVIKKIVADDSKNRYTLTTNENKEYIRANQGHSINVETLELKQITLDEATSYSIIVHGTYSEHCPKIKEEGLSKMSRQHVHMVSLSDPNAFSLMRANVNMYIVVDMYKAICDGIPFYVSANNVILSSGNDSGYIPAKYLTFLEKVPYNCPCAGCIVVGFDNDFNVYLAMVATPKGNLSFPKGKLNKKEPSLQGALRETEEETGIKHNDLYFWNVPLYQEMSDKNNYATSYYLAMYTGIVSNESKLTPQDPLELTMAEWIPYKKIINWNDNEEKYSLLDRRIDIAKQIPVDDMLQFIMTEIE